MFFKVRHCHYNEINELAFISPPPRTSHLNQPKMHTITHPGLNKYQLTINHLSNQLILPIKWLLRMQWLIRRRVLTNCTNINQRCTHISSHNKLIIHFIFSQHRLRVLCNAFVLNLSFSIRLKFRNNWHLGWWWLN